jgi:phage baseplate assembly protein W
VKPEYYCLPLALDRVLQKQDIPRCTLQQSVQYHLHLIITTAFGEMSNDAEYGCWIWENDFDNLTTNNKIREQIKLSLVKAVRQYEPRMQNVKVEVLIRQEEQVNQMSSRQVKKMLDITVSGTLSATKEVVICNDRFFTGPLSYH